MEALYKTREGQEVTKFLQIGTQRERNFSQEGYILFHALPRDWNSPIFKHREGRETKVAIRDSFNWLRLSPAKILRRRPRDIKGDSKE